MKTQSMANDWLEEQFPELTADERTEHAFELNALLDKVRLASREEVLEIVTRWARNGVDLTKGCRCGR